jgi:hypothetical protein
MTPRWLVSELRKVKRWPAYVLSKGTLSFKVAADMIFYSLFAVDLNEREILVTSDLNDGLDSTPSPPNRREISKSKFDSASARTGGA